MRPQLFKMASDLQPNEEGMTEILQTNDSLIRVLEHYKRTVKPGGAEQSTSGTTPTTEATPTIGATPPANKKPGSPTGAELLLDLTDLNFGAPTLPMTNGTATNIGGGDSSVAMTTGLLGDINLLGKQKL